MRRIFAGLVLVMLATMSGCVKEAHVEKGGGETAVLVLDERNRITGAIDVDGHVVNLGGRTAKDVVVYFKFYDDGTLYLEDDLLLGDISGGSSASFSGRFNGKQVKASTFTWEYRIEWDD